MTTRLLFLTKDPEIGRIAERAGVDWIFVDLEYRGKSDRQSGRDTVISAHSIEDVVAMRAAITTAQLLVRVNPLGEWSREEIDGAIDAGADIVMLPFFTTPGEVEAFVTMVGGRAKACLLVETMGAVDAIEEILAVPGIDFIHIGLNDIHIERQTRFMFELLGDGTLDMLAAKIRPTGIPFGIGGMARIGEKIPPRRRSLPSIIGLAPRA
ncbi:aldolase/citrate lyase family protein [Sphingomonas leidyi]|uniref:aldolase/citrate lyase family protein n=1 Tax=Sphingomonas leidyi TaxID=68569 RepID=UPI0036D25F47